MKISNTGLEFIEFNEFKNFVVDYDLLGSVSLSEPIIDKNGNILIKEKVAIKENLLNKLAGMDGNFIPAFKLAMSKDLMRMLKFVLCKAVLKRIEDRNNEFIFHLYEQNAERMASLKGIIQNSFYSKPIALSFFRILLNHKEFFNYIADFGLLCLGAVIQKKYMFKMVNRYSFLAGLCADIGLSKDVLYKQTFVGDPLSSSVNLSAEIARKLMLPEEVVSAITGHPLAKFDIPGMNPAKFDMEELRKHSLNQELLTGSGLGDENMNEDEEEG
ncbi:hypothetical protein P3G55_03675, partial [Leptospira sp. 96542]|nr:hypothetical protein [Leptospira sp. 96542]